MIKKISLYIMVVFYVAAGVNHFAHPAVYLDIMPPWLPYPLGLVWLSGICEIVSGALLIPPQTRQTGAWLVILLLIAVFPANIQMALNYHNGHNPSLWAAILRLPVQLLLIAWAASFTKTHPIKKPA